MYTFKCTYPKPKEITNELHRTDSVAEPCLIISLYIMDYTEQTTHSNITDDTLSVAFNFNDNSPYALVEITSLSIKTSTDSNTAFFFKTQELGENYGGDVDSGTTIAVASL